MARKLALAVVLAMLAGVVLITTPAPARASSADEVVFEGSGWGHGVGLSQYGARGMAVLGSTHQQIVAHYYQGSAISPAPAPSPLWVNLERNFTNLTLTVGDVGSPGTADPVQVSGPSGSVAAVSGATLALAALPAGCQVTVTNPGQAPAVVSDPGPGCSVDMQWYNWSDPEADPTTKLTIEGCTLPDWNVIPTTNRPCQYALGELHLRSGPGGLDLSAEMLYDDYVAGTSEMPYGWPGAAVRAQAIASRSYAVAMQMARGAPATNGCDGWCHVKDTTADQRYVGWGHGATEPWLAAVAATSNQVLTHGNAPFGVVEAFFSSSSGGATESGHERFGGPAKSYLMSVDDSWAVDGTVPNSKASWINAVSVDAVKSALDFDVLYAVSVKTRRTSGSAWTIEFTGSADGQSVIIEKSGTWVRSAFGLYSEFVDVAYAANPTADEMFFYRDNGEFEFNKMNPDGTTSGTILQGSGYTSDWTSITSIDLDGDGQDEMFFYRNDGLFRFYDVNPDGTLGAPILAGSGYTTGWDSITAIDLDGDGQDEMFFYRNDGLFRFYDIRSDGTLPSPMLAGSGYTTGWDSITAVDLDGDQHDEMFFYRVDGLFRFYDIRSDGTLPSPMLAGSGYTTGWDSILAVDLEGDGQDEMFFYRADGLYRYYNVSSSGQVGSPTLAGSDYPSGWDSITAIQLD